ncbi:hypothetical protein AFB00_17350 [Pseudonocardia sp. HH130630-07]|nr:hypothetical protein AFB00_17350 [Pseudonocardia sp. HH130630-07]
MEPVDADGVGLSAELVEVGVAVFAAGLVPSGRTAISTDPVHEVEPVAQCEWTKVTLDELFS